MSAARVRATMTDAECAAADRTLPRGTALEALAGWTGALLVGAGTWTAIVVGLRGVL